MTIIDLLDLIRKQWWLLVVFPLVFAGATAAYSWGYLTNDYRAETTLLVLTKTSDKTDSVTSSDFSLSSQIVADMGQLANSAKVKNAAANKLGMDSLSGYTIAVESSTKNRVMSVTVTGKQPESVAMVANAVAEQVAKISLDTMQLESVTVVDPAVAPTSPVGPNRVGNTLIAALAGLVAAIFLIILMDTLNVRVKTTDEVTELTELPLLARVPKVKGL